MDTKLVFKKLAAFDKADALLISIRNQMYDGDWEAMLCHLRNNLLTKGYIIKFANKLRNDICRVEALIDLGEDDLSDICESCGTEVA